MNVMVFTLALWTQDIYEPPLEEAAAGCAPSGHPATPLLVFDLAAETSADRRALRTGSDPSCAYPAKTPMKCTNPVSLSRIR